MNEKINLGLDIFKIVLPYESKIVNNFIKITFLDIDKQNLNLSLSEKLNFDLDSVNIKVSLLTYYDELDYQQQETLRSIIRSLEKQFIQFCINHATVIKTNNNEDYFTNVLLNDLDKNSSYMIIFDPFTHNALLKSNYNNYLEKIKDHKCDITRSRFMAKDKIIIIKKDFVNVVVNNKSIEYVTFKSSETRSSGEITLYYDFELIDNNKIIVIEQ